MYKTAISYHVWLNFYAILGKRYLLTVGDDNNPWGMVLGCRQDMDAWYVCQ